ncbi:MAG: ABC transporter substrate-binding protein [Actinomycetes bacterium]
MTHLRHLRAAAIATSLALTLVACGQKPGVHVEGSTGGLPVAGGGLPADGGTEGLDGGGTFSLDGGTEAPLDGGTEGGLDTGGDLGGSTDAGTTGGDAGGQTGGSAGGQTGGSAGGSSGGQTGGSSGGQTGGSSGGSTGGGQKIAPRGSNTTGAPADKIVIGIHAPVTGAAPLPSTSFAQAGDLYWKYITEDQKQTVVGRNKVEVVFRDDKYDPANARQVCREMANSAFLLVGGGGTDQIQACGQLAGSSGFPYFSAGVTEAGLGGNPWYFASSMTYRQQGVLLGQYIAKNPDNVAGLGGSGKIAAVVTATDNFNDALAGFEQGIKNAGLSGRYAGATRPGKGDANWYGTVAQDLKAKGVKIVYINASPVDYIRFAQKAREANAGFQYVGVGITMGLNAVLNSGCPDVDKGVFFSPFPGLDKAPAEFKAAGQKFGKPTDDISLALWGLASQQHELFKRYEQTFEGTKLTREDFRALTEAQGSLPPAKGVGVFPAVGYSSSNHFGGQGVHVLQADCGPKQYKTLQAFAKGF